eukprot:TRINITY_DN21804_c0_g1_i1.p1 TRINITY_DN21804_c0_g1~~TRINITY_DN21804_c0_g1_i1.p1  ORF type:complete len:337 (-),score=61.93 TRINITY_DN21804_c0_g1_i1:49-1059(-)
MTRKRKIHSNHDDNGSDVEPKPSKKQKISSDEKLTQQSAKQIEVPRIPLHNTAVENMAMPSVGFGTFKLKKTAVKPCLKYSLLNGYTMIDTATIYDNEKEIGQILSSFKRESLFITTKLWRSHQGTDEIVEKQLRLSMKRLGIEQLDLWLMHWPGPGKGMFKKNPCPADWSPSMRASTWKKMVDLHKKGLIKAVGVSNFTVKHLKDLKERTGILPAVNQIELHPFYIPQDILDYCEEEKILITAYSSLGAGSKELLEHETVQTISSKLHRSPAQVLLRWGIQKGAVVIPCSTKEEHIRDNILLFDFEISKEDMAALSSLHCNKRFGWKKDDPNIVP